jgi:N-glycosidase YbiA
VGLRYVWLSMSRSTQLEIIFGEPNPDTTSSGGMDLPAERTAPVRVTAPRRIGGSSIHGHKVRHLEVLPRERPEPKPTTKRPLVLDEADPLCEAPEIPHFKLRPEHRPPVQRVHRFFYGTKGGAVRTPGILGEREPALYFMSNFYRGAPFTLDHKVFATSEHYYQTQKWICVDPVYAEKVRTAPTAAEAKKLGGSTHKPMRADWEDVRVEVMRRAIHAKFTQNADIREKLLATGNDALHEDAPLDSVWGLVGKDLLGRLLIEERTLLRGLPE